MRNYVKIVEQGYNRVYAAYHAERKARTVRDELRELLTLLPEQSKVLDVGCGSGVVARQLVSKNMKVVGIDISKEMLKLARRNESNAIFRRMNMLRLLFPPNSFDAIVCLNAIIHVPRQHHYRVLRAMHRILRREGWLLITTGVGGYTGIEDNWLETGVRMYWSHFGKSENLKLIRKSGFAVKSYRVVGGDRDKHLLVLARK